MTQKFENFRTALVALCTEHGVSIGTSGYDCIEAWDVDEYNKPDDIWLENCIKETA